MVTLLHRPRCSPSALEALSAQDAAALLTHAALLQRQAAEGASQPLLRGKKFGLLCASDDDAASLFRRAAFGLGAHVASVRPGLSEQSTPLEVQHTARVLGRLYDALACQGLAPALVQRIGDASGVPVFDGIASRSHALAMLAGQLDGDASAEDKRCFALQAALLAVIA